jgi:hypothetical protein
MKTAVETALSPRRSPPLRNLCIWGAPPCDLLATTVERMSPALIRVRALRFSSTAHRRAGLSSSRLWPVLSRRYPGRPQPRPALWLDPWRTAWRTRTPASGSAWLPLAYARTPIGSAPPLAPCLPVWGDGDHVKAQCSTCKAEHSSLQLQDSGSGQCRNGRDLAFCSGVLCCKSVNSRRLSTSVFFPRLGPPTEVALFVISFVGNAPG